MSIRILMPNVDHSDRVREIVANYCRNERSDERKPFEVHGAFDRKTVIENKFAEAPGCYVIYTSNGSLRYVGMSVDSVGYRSRSHFSAGTQASPFWKRGGAFYIELIVVQELWEAHSLEAYLTIETDDIRKNLLL